MAPCDFWNTCFKEGLTLQLQFDADPGRRTGLVEVMDGITAGIRQNGPDAEMVEKVKKYMLKQHADDLKKNEHALRTTWQHHVHGVDLEAGCADQVNGLSTASLQHSRSSFLGRATVWRYP